MSTRTYWWMRGFWGTKLLGKTLGQWFVLVIVICFTLAFWKMGSVSSMDVFWAWLVFALTILALTFPGPVTLPIRVVRKLYLDQIRPLQVPAKPPNLLKTLSFAAVAGFLVWFIVPTWFSTPLDRYVTYGCIALGIVAVTTIALTHLEETAGGRKPWLVEDRLNQIQAVTKEGLIQTSNGLVALSIVHGKMSGFREALAPEDKLSFLSSALLAVAANNRWEGGVIGFIASIGGLPTDPSTFDDADSSFVRGQAELLTRGSKQKILLLAYDPEIEEKLSSYLREVGLQLVRLRQNEVLAFLGEVINGDVFLESAVKNKEATVSALLPDRLSFGEVAQFGENYLGVVAVVVRNGKEIAQAEEAAQTAGAKLFLTMVAPSAVRLKNELEGRRTAAFFKPGKRAEVEDWFAKIFASGPETKEYLFNTTVVLLVSAPSEEGVRKKLSQVEHALGNMSFKWLKGRELEQVITTICLPTLSASDTVVGVLDMLQVVKKLTTPQTELLASQIAGEYLSGQGGTDLTFARQTKGSVVIGHGVEKGAERPYFARLLRDFLVTLVLGDPGKGKSMWAKVMFLRVGNSLRRIVVNLHPADTGWPKVVEAEGGIVLRSGDEVEFQKVAEQALFQTNKPVLFQPAMGTTRAEEDSCGMIFLELTLRLAQKGKPSLLIIDEAHIYMLKKLGEVGSVASGYLNELCKKARNHQMAIILICQSLADFQNALGATIRTTFLGFKSEGIKLFFNLGGVVKRPLLELGFPRHLQESISQTLQLMGYFYLVTNQGTAGWLKLPLTNKEMELATAEGKTIGNDVPRLFAGRKENGEMERKIG